MQTVFADRTATYEELLNKASLPSLANRRLQDILILMYKVYHSLAPEHNILSVIFSITTKKFSLRRVVLLLVSMLIGQDSMYTCQLSRLRVEHFGLTAAHACGPISHA